jgi:AcrR family transcriptional regulator
MSPHPAQVDRDTIIQTAWNLIEEHGLDQVSLHTLAKTLDIKAPSLYNHIANKTDLLRAVNMLTMQRLMAFVGAAIDAAGDDLHARLFAMADAYRAYAYTHPAIYQLFNNSEVELYPDIPSVITAVSKLEALTGELAGPENALNALRGLWALVHGFIALEMAGHMRRDEATFEDSWRAALAAFFRGWR